MDDLMLPVIFGFLGVLLLVKLVFKSNSRLIKGWVGEFYVNYSAKRLLDKNTYHLIKNVTLPTEDSTTQIDHIIVSRYGVFVVETKNMAGWIFGGERQKTWTQKIYKHTNQFQNPLKQNYAHKKALEEILGIVPDKIFSVIVFVGDSHFKTDMPPNVTYAKGYIGYIKSKSEPLFGDYEVEEIIQKIAQFRLKPGLKTHFEHIENVKNKHSNGTTRKTRASGSLSPVTKTVFAAIAFLIIATVVTNNFSDKATTQGQLSSTPKTKSYKENQPPENSSAQYHAEKTPPAQRKDDKIYAYKDEDGRTQFTNVGVPEDGQLVHDSSITNNQQDSLPIEISDNKIYVPVTIGHRGKQMTTSLLLERESNKTVLPKRIADFVNADNVRVTSTPVVHGKVIQGDTIRVNYFNVGSVIENNFIITSTSEKAYSRQGILGMDFIVRHPFQIDVENKVLVWQ